MDFTQAIEQLGKSSGSMAEKASLQGALYRHFEIHDIIRLAQRLGGSVAHRLDDQAPEA